MKKVDLNVDIGEGFPFDDALMKFATSVNIGCGEHAGSWEITLATVQRAKSLGKRIGIHPGFPDRESMGRTTPVGNAPTLQKSLVSQVVSFMDVERANYLKPHGAWYNLLTQVGSDSVAHESAALASQSLFAILKEYRLPIMIMPCRLATILGENRVIREGFADRGYTEDGFLVPRGEPCALLEDPKEVRAQVVSLAETVDSICLHGDGEHCLEFAETVYRTLTESGFEVSA